MKYRLLYHVYDYTSDEDIGVSSYRHFYAKDDESAKRKVNRIVRYTLDVECGIMTSLKLFHVIQRKTKHKQEIMREVSLKR